MACVIGTEGRIKHARPSATRRTTVFQGLDFWSPNINIFRDPRWGRGQETYGEDPFLTARMGVAFVTGMQGDDPKYYRTISTPKHYAVHSGPEPTRHTADVKVSKHDESTRISPHFAPRSTEGQAGSVMCAYNSINGEPACANQFLLQDTLRGKWNFQGYVVSDCEAVVDIYREPSLTNPPSLRPLPFGLQRGMDNECADLPSSRTTRLQGLHRRGASRASSRKPVDTALCVSSPRACGSACLIRRRSCPTQRSMRTSGQSGPSPAGPQDRQRIDGAAQEQRHAAAQDQRQAHRGRRSARRSDRRLLGNYNGTPHTPSPCWKD